MKLDFSRLNYGGITPSALLTFTCNNCHKKYSSCFAETDTAIEVFKQLCEFKQSEFINGNKVKEFICKCGQVLNIEDFNVIPEKNAADKLNT